jgi:predicted SnoaL-like aldol condensation-catalyzing enzyme
VRSCSGTDSEQEGTRRHQRRRTDKDEPVKIFSPLRTVTFLAALFAMLRRGFGVALAAGNHPPGNDGVLGVFNGDHDSEACVHSTALLERNEANVINFYRISFNDKNPELAVKLYGGDEYIQHNPLATNGFPAFIQFVTSFTTQFPDTHVDIKRVFADCDFVITHSLFTGAVPAYGPLGSKGVDIFRLDTNGKIVEHWDVVARLSSTSANGNPEV